MGHLATVGDMFCHSWQRLQNFSFCFVTTNTGTQQRRRDCNSLGCTPEDDCDDKCFGTDPVTDFVYLEANGQKVCGHTNAVDMTAADAFAACSSLSGQLPMPFDQITLNNINELSKLQTPDVIWLGVYRKKVKGKWLSAYDGKPYSRPYPIGTGNNKDDQMYLGPISCSI